MYAEIVSAAKSAKALGDLVKAARELSNYTEFVAAVSEVSTKLMDATAVALESQEKQSELNQKVKELELKLASIEDWEAEISRYQLFEFETKTFAFALKEGMENGEPNHYLCATCVNKREKYILQPSSSYSLKCPECKNSIQIKPKPKRNFSPGIKHGSWMG